MTGAIASLIGMAVGASGPGSVDAHSRPDLFEVYRFEDGCTIRRVVRWARGRYRYFDKILEDMGILKIFAAEAAKMDPDLDAIFVLLDPAGGPKSLLLRNVYDDPVRSMFVDTTVVFPRTAAKDNLQWYAPGHWQRFFVDAVFGDLRNALDHGLTRSRDGWLEKFQWPDYLPDEFWDDPRIVDLTSKPARFWWDLMNSARYSGNPGPLFDRIDALLLPAARDAGIGVKADRYEHMVAWTIRWGEQDLQLHSPANPKDFLKRLADRFQLMNSFTGEMIGKGPTLARAFDRRALKSTSEAFAEIDAGLPQGHLVLDDEIFRLLDEPSPLLGPTPWFVQWAEAVSPESSPGGAR